MSTLLRGGPTISNFQALHGRLGLHRTTDISFFSEWQAPAEPLNASDRAFLDHLQQRYHNYYNAGLLTEGTVLLSMVAPLLEKLGFHEPPFFVRSEVPVSIEVTERDEIYSVIRTHSDNASHLACCHAKVLPASLYSSQVTNAI